MYILECYSLVSKQLDYVKFLIGEHEINPVCLSLADWKYRHAGLMALSAIGEGCHQQMEAILQEIVSFVLLFCSDPVRDTASDFNTKIQLMVDSVQVT